jgi:hypothetical protein
MKALLPICLLLVACGGESVSSASQPLCDLHEREYLACGGVPALEGCETSSQFKDLTGCPSLTCEGWPEHPYGEAHHFVQVIACDGTRGVLYSGPGNVVCADRWLL